MTVNTDELVVVKYEPVSGLEDVFIDFIIFKLAKFWVMVRISRKSGDHKSVSTIKFYWHECLECFQRLSK